MLNHLTFPKLLRPLVCVLLSLALLCTLTSPLLSAQAVTQAEINRLKAQREELSQQQAALEDDLSALSQQKDAALKEYQLLDQQMSLITDQINTTNQLIADYEADIAQTQMELAQAEAEEEEAFQLFCQRVRSMEEGESISYWSILFTSADFSDLLDRLQLVSDIMAYSDSVVEDLRLAKEAVADKEAQLQEGMAQQQAALTDLESQKADLDVTYQKSQAALAEVQRNMSAYESQLAQLEADAAELEQDIVSSEAAYAAQLKAAQEAAAKAAANRQQSGGNTTTYVDVSGSEVVAYAMQFVGNPYVWGGTSLTKGCDCSGFTLSVYAHFGVSLPHSSVAQRNYGTGVSYADAQPGDLICYSANSSGISHVGIYIGGGMMVNAISSSKGIGVSTVNTSRVVTVRHLVDG